MTDREVLNAIAELKNLQGDKKYKYRRNYRYYNFSSNATLDNIRNPTTVGYIFGKELGEEQDTSACPQLNIIASCIDTLVSKIAQSKVRPFFNTVNGNFKDIQCVKQAQQYFDILFDEEHVNKTVSEAFKDACIFDTGVVYINEECCTIQRALPFQVYFRPAEQQYGTITRIYYEQTDFPVTLLPTKIVHKFKRKNLDYVNFGVYYDTVHNIKAYTANGSIVYTEVYDKPVVPFLFIYYKNPVVGSSTTSVVDMLCSLQQEINILMAKIKDASQLNPALTFMVPEGSNVKTTQLNNRVGNVLTYKPLATGQLPVAAATPAFIDGQYMSLLNELVAKAYEMVGISQLSAMSKKPTGLDAGIALSTMENIESDRFETQLNAVIRMYVDIAKTCIKVFDEVETILPEVKTRTAIKWKDILKEADNMNIQYSAADSLSKDPSTKLQQLQQLAQAGVIPVSRIAQLLQIPDIETGYSFTNNAIDAVMELIRECLETDDPVTVPEYIPFELLKEEIINTQLALKAAGRKENEKDIEKLSMLYQQVEEQNMQWQADVQMEAEAQNQGQPQDGMPASTNILTQEANMTQVPDVADAVGQEQDNAAWVNNADFDRQ